MFVRAPPTERHGLVWSVNYPHPYPALAIASFAQLAIPSTSSGESRYAHPSVIAEMKILTVLVVSWVVHISTGFIPVRYAAYGYGSTIITHKDMTRAAILDVAAEILSDNPNPDSEGSSSRITALSSHSEESLVMAYYGERDLSRIRSFEDAIDAISDANADVDLGQEEVIAAAHFDSEQFQAGQNRLVELRQNIVAQISMENFDMARTDTGRMFHTLQDFYSHSNWVENGNREPYHVLGRESERPSNIASPTTQTCTNCQEVSSAALYYYRCRDNILRTLSRTLYLTSGYYGGQRDSQGQEIKKPRGKCSHGGLFDTTADDIATGGINKDTPIAILSPHFYRYPDAARMAQQATANLLLEIRSDVGNDQLFLRYLGLMARAISIAYVIDTTGSFRSELPELQATIPTIRENLQNQFAGSIQVNYILVPFNDPGK